MLFHLENVVKNQHMNFPTERERKAYFYGFIEAIKEVQSIIELDSETESQFKQLVEKGRREFIHI